MDAIDIMMNSLKDGIQADCLRFDRYTITRAVQKRSQQGTVFVGHNYINKYFAIKICRPTYTDPQILKDTVKRFLKEIKITVSLNHKNIVRIISAGKAIWMGNEWDVQEGFNDGSTDLENNEYLYLVMDFIEGADVSALFPEITDESDAQIEQSSLSERLKLFEEMITQVSAGISYYHSKKVTHKDIKPDNIRYSSSDSTFIIVDFGFARHIESPQEKDTILRTQYIDLPSIYEQNYESNDMGQFCQVLLRILPIFKDQYGKYRYSGIFSTLQMGAGELAKRPKNMNEFYKSVAPFLLTLPQWKFELKLDEYFCSNQFGKFSRRIRIPVSGSILLADEVKSIIDKADFQRLRGVRQLGPTIFVYPGANHTRYEHSLGTCDMALRYIEKLFNQSHFRGLCKPIDESIKLIVLSALMHDIGHYPYSHWIEEVDRFPKNIKFPSHEDRARSIICGGAIGKVVRNEWGIDPNRLCNIIANRHLDEGRSKLINSILNSAIDVDKVDYLVRDSVHCGVNYGKGLDVERMLDSLYVDPESQQICLTDKGKSCLTSIIACRNIMYQEVYWHKTVRACDAMFKRLMYEYIKLGIDSKRTIENFFNYPDDYFISKLLERIKDNNNQELEKLVRPFAFSDRELYKPAYTFSRGTLKTEPTDTFRFFDKVINSSTYKTLVDKSELLAKYLKRYIHELEPIDIIIEKAPTKQGASEYELQGFRFWNTRKDRWEGYSTEVESMNNYLKNNIQAYIFCNPDYYNEMKRLVSDGKLDKLLGEIEDN